MKITLLLYFLFSFILVYYLERTIHVRSHTKCHWSKWESWPHKAKPFHVALVADPQIVDNGTYNYPRPLLRLVQFIADQYLFRHWRYLHKKLQPDLTIIMGDLMDTGREFNLEEWDKDLERFNKIFDFNAAEHVEVYPGNHDIGFGEKTFYEKIKTFESTYGSTSRSVIAGNHTLALVDGIRLSNTLSPDIYGKPKSYLEFLNKKKEPSSPRILFGHVPLYRPDGTSCGKLREQKDTISFGYGYQYQNVLSKELSEEVLKNVEPVAAFAGDDHDYCEVVHSYNDDYGSLKEVPEYNVKAFAMTSGIRRPGYQLLSLYYVHEEGKAPSESYQTHPCLLPDQIAIYLFYGICSLFLFVVVTYYANDYYQKSGRLLPLYHTQAQNRRSNSRRHYKSIIHKAFHHFIFLTWPAVLFFLVLNVFSV
ncbi:GPI-remodelling mannose-ethanolamine phosphate phosphodiesterase [Schizosaccharomyces osmophilus]|uniref:GPI-remodelling mannose-ethanolamine phosphate phosphodiesterase n=1 Tax=Schizosaccharomyces osmophilus TaxID=2545709 RepID=A0AAE9W7A1_9SCHI|nr:GPI-remodelling mannose-ethanolamine phosphate phosphodiesterase [Schizosaccharomyces osmophilus]WBW71216.1 GPI-remodelling mannose-ethanolamine phosphate phosphodiesterase [Schizosaccharomyces osmophilus]